MSSNDIRKEAFLQRQQEIKKQNGTQNISTNSNKKKNSLFRTALILNSMLLALGTCFVCYLSLQFEQIERSLLDRSSNIVDTSYGPVEVSVFGQGPPVLLLHGSPGGFDQGKVFGKFVLKPNEVKGDSFTFISISRPGYLRTPLNKKNHRPEQQADLYEEILDNLGYHSVAVVAMDTSIPSAIHYANKYPDKCWALILLNSVTPQPSASLGQSSYLFKFFYTSNLLSNAIYLFQSRLPSLYQYTLLNTKFFQENSRDFDFFLRMSRTTALAGDRSDGFYNDIKLQQQKLPKIKNEKLVLELNGNEKFDERYVNLGFIPLNILQDKILRFLDEKSSFVVY